jgi:hypothetical protein
MQPYVKTTKKIQNWLLDIGPVQISQLWRPISLSATVGSSCNFDTRCIIVLGIPSSNFKFIQPLKRPVLRSKWA